MNVMATYTRLFNHLKLNGYEFEYSGNGVVTMATPGMATGYPLKR